MHSPMLAASSALALTCPPLPLPSHWRASSHLHTPTPFLVLFDGSAGAPPLPERTPAHIVF